MTEWNEQRLKELVRKMGLERSHGYEQSPIHLSLYNSPYADAYPLLTQIMTLDTNEWQILGYAETDRVSVTRYLGGLNCRTDDALSVAARWQHPLTLELAKALVDVGARDENALWQAAVYQKPLTLELAKALVDVGCDPAAQDRDGWDALVCLAVGGHPVDPQVTELFLSCGCRTDLNGCEYVEDKFRLRFDQILKEHAVWEESRGRMLAENFPTDTFYGPDWGR